MFNNTMSYSQAGQDIIIRNKFKKSNFKTWYYVDVGCHHPIKFNNTYMFYCLGASGLNIDANKDYEIFYQRHRGGDRFCCAAIGDHAVAGDGMKYYRYSKDQWNGLSENVAKKDFLIGIDDVKVRQLNDILRENDAPIKIDLLSMDVEGHEIDVLNSVDMSYYDFRCICLEARTRSVESYLTTEIHNYMKSLGYIMFCHTGHDAIYVKP